MKKKKKEGGGEAKEPKKERKPNWQEVYATVEDIRQFLDERVLLRYNVVTRRVEVHWLTDFGDAPPGLDDWEPLTDRLVNSLWVELSEQKQVRVQDIFRVIASFCGTGNSLQFLSDPTGNRRWLPFEVDSIEPPHDNPLDYNGIYSQAYALYRQGFRYWFTQQEIERLAQHNQQFETANLELELVAQYFRKPQGQEPSEFISAAMALQIIGANITQKLSKEYVGRAFTSLGFDSRRTNKMRGYIVVRRSAEEMRSMRYQLAAPSKSDSDGGDSIF